MTTRLADLGRRFRDYAAGYLTGDTENDFHIRLKIDHSLRVADTAAHIVAAEGFEPTLAELTHIAALFHDVGRFSQYRDYGTFRDANSVNHGRRGVHILRAEPFLAELDSGDRRTVRAAVGLHNVRALSPRLTGPLSMVARVVRDSDKLDILPILIDHFGRTDDQSGVVVLDVDSHPTRYTPGMLTDILAGNVGTYEKMRYVNDFRLLLISWVYDLNFPASFAKLKAIKALDALFDGLPDDPGITDLHDTIDNFVKNAAKGKELS